MPPATPPGDYVPRSECEAFRARLTDRQLSSAEWRGAIDGTLQHHTESISVLTDKMERLYVKVAAVSAACGLAGGLVIALLLKAIAGFLGGSPSPP